MANKEIRLGRLELRIMNVVWANGKATVQQVKDTLDKEKKSAYSTILTMMRKLEEKDFLTHEQVNRTYVYSAVISQQTVRCSFLSEMIERLFDGSPSLLATNLFDQKSVTEKELKAIQQLLKEKDAM